MPLALSLHAPNQTLRERIVPVASKGWPLPKLIAALDAHIEAAQAEDKSGGRKFTGVMIECVRSPEPVLTKHAMSRACLGKSHDRFSKKGDLFLKKPAGLHNPLHNALHNVADTCFSLE